MYMIYGSLILFSLCAAHEEKLDTYGDDRCEGIYAAQDIPFSSRESSLEISFSQISAPAIISVLIYNIRDEALFHGKGLGENFDTDPTTDKFIVKEDPPIYNEVIRVNSSGEAANIKIEYTIPETGFYCTIIYTRGMILILTSRHAFSRDCRVQGSLRPTLRPGNSFPLYNPQDYPKLPLHGFLSIFYLATAIFWFILCSRHWRDLLQLQIYLSGVIVFLMIEQAFSYGFYDNYNVTGDKSKVLAVFVAVLNAGRNTVSLFILLIVCLGFGVIRPTLGGNLMRKCVTLSIAHFIFGVVYSGGSLYVTHITSGLLVMMV
jgi:hypothetical protein